MTRGLSDVATSQEMWEAFGNPKDKEMESFLEPNRKMSPKTEF